MIRAVVFDADDTLIDFDSSMWSSLRAVHPMICDLGDVASVLTVDDLHADWLAVWRAKEAPMADVRREAFRRTLERVGAGDAATVDRISGAYCAHRRVSSSTFPDVAPMLAALGTRYRLGYATNGNTTPEVAGLDGVFAFTVFAYVDGLPSKPSPRFYERVVTLAGVAAEEIVFVGDDWLNDVTGPISAGMHAVWLNRTGEPKPPGDAAEIATLADLPDVLRTLS